MWISRLAAAVKPSFAGEAEVLGIKTVMIKTEVRSEAGESYRSTEWRAPDLGCVVLKVMEERLDDSGKVTGKFEIQPLTVTVGAPDSRLFEIPLDYAEVTPSQASEANRAKGGGTGRPVPGDDAEARAGGSELLRESSGRRPEVSRKHHFDSSHLARRSSAPGFCCATDLPGSAGANPPQSSGVHYPARQADRRREWKCLRCA